MTLVGPKMPVTWGQHSTMVGILASGLSCPRFDSQRSPKTFQRKQIVDVVAVNQLHYLEESGQWLQKVD